MNRAILISVGIGLIVIVVIVLIIVLVLTPWRKTTVTMLRYYPSTKKTVAYYCGERLPVRFSADTTKLGGSETAVVELSRALQMLDYQVFVFGDVKEGEFDRVIYSRKFPVDLKFNYLILWRGYGISKISELKRSNYEKILLDLHEYHSIDSFRGTEVCQRIMFKSKYQQSFYKGIQLPIADQRVVPNGITDIAEYLENRHVKKDRFKFVYTSCYLRGLEGLLRYAWPLILEHFPQCQLHVYYGMELVNRRTRNRISDLIRGTDRVYDHGRVSRDVMRRECADAYIHLYPCTISEIDCISVKESALSGIIPVIPNSFVLKERAGVHFDGIPGSKEFFENGGKTCIRLIEDYDNYANVITDQIDPILRQTVLSWMDVARSWSQIFDE